MPKLKVVKENGAKVYPVTIVKGVYDTENSQPLSKTLASKADSTTLEEAVKDDKTFAVLIALANNFLCGATWEVSENPEYSYALVDSDEKVICAKKVDDGSWILGDDVDTLFNSFISTIDNTVSRTLSELRISDAYTKTEVDSMLESNTTNAPELYYTKANVAILVVSMFISWNNCNYSLEDNPEWKFVFTDSEDKVLFGIKEDNTLYQGLEWNDLLDFLISNYTVETEVASVGTFSEVPTSPSVGQSFFCTDKQTTEGATNGIMIYYNGTSWVDALGREITDTTTDETENTTSTDTTEES